MDDFSGKLREDLAREIKQAQKTADYVIVCPHMGGQFNLEPGTFSKYMMDFFQAQGTDCVVANHSHVVQRSEWREDMLACYCLGDFSVFSSSPGVVKEQLSEYLIMLHLYLDDSGPGLVTSPCRLYCIKKHRGQKGVAYCIFC